MIIRNFKIYTNKINKHFLISLDSDWHISSNGSVTNALMVNKVIKEIKPDIRIIAGDIIDDTSTLLGNNVKKIVKILKESESICPTLISLGNHDISKISFTDNIKWHQDLRLNWYQELENNTSSKLVYNNKLYEGTVYLNDKIEIISLNPPYSYYFTNRESTDNFLSIYQKRNINFLTDESYYHILVVHSASALIELVDTLSIVKNADLILSGHMHGGMLPLIIRNIVEFSSTHYGLCTPNQKILKDAKYCYGKIVRNNKIFLINPGLTKIGPEKGLISNLNCIYPSEMYTIDLIPIKKRSLKR